MPLPPRRGLPGQMPMAGGAQSQASLGGRPPMGGAPGGMPGAGGAPGGQSGGGQQQGGMPSPRALAAKELMLKSELLKVQAMKALMGPAPGAAKGKRGAGPA